MASQVSSLTWQQPSSISHIPQRMYVFPGLGILWIRRHLGLVSWNLWSKGTLLLHSLSLWSVFSATRISSGFFLPHPLFPLVFFPVLLFGAKGSSCSSPADAFWDDRTVGWWQGQEGPVSCDVRAWNPQDDLLTHVHLLNTEPPGTEDILDKEKPSISKLSPTLLLNGPLFAGTDVLRSPLLALMIKSLIWT